MRPTGEADQIQQLMHARCRIIHPKHLSVELEILEHRQVRIQEALMRKEAEPAASPCPAIFYRTLEQPQSPTTRSQEGGDETQKSALPCPVRTQNCHGIARFDAQVGAS